MGKITRFIDRVSMAFTHISGVLFLIICLVVLANIITRALFNFPVKGTVGIVQLGMLICIGLVLCRSGFEERHICVMLLVDKLPPRAKAIVLALGKLISGAVFTIIAYLFFKLVPEAARLNKVTDTFRIQYFYFYAALGIGFVIAAIVFYYQCCQSVAAAVKGGAVSEYVDVDLAALEAETVEPEAVEPEAVEPEAVEPEAVEPTED